MNLPSMPPGQPPGAPPQPQYQQPQAQGGYQAPPQGGYQQPNLQAAGNANVSASLMSPAYTPGNRQKVDDGEHIVQITLAEIRNSQAGPGQFFLIEYTVVQSTVPSNVGQSYGHALKWEKPWQVDECCDLYKRLFGEEQAAQLAIQRPSVDQVVQHCCHALQQWTQTQAIYARLLARRSQKKLREGTPYAEAYPNHTFLDFGTQPPALSAGAAPTPQQPQPATGAMPQPPQQPQPATGAMPQPMGPPNPAAAPQQPQYQQPQPQAQPPAPQQPQYQQPAQPQAPQQPQYQQPQQQPPAGGPPPMPAFGQ